MVGIITYKCHFISLEWITVASEHQVSFLDNVIVCLRPQPCSKRQCIIFFSQFLLLYSLHFLQGVLDVRQQGSLVRGDWVGVGRPDRGGEGSDSVLWFVVTEGCSNTHVEHLGNSLRLISRNKYFPDLGWRGEAFAIFFYFDWNINEHGSLLTSNTRLGRLPVIFERIFLDLINFLLNILL